MAAAQRESARLFWWSGRLLYVGSVGINTVPHAHHAVQVSIALAGRIRLRSDPSAEWTTCEAAIVPANQRHQLDAEANRLALFYFDPQCEESDRIVAPRVADARDGIVFIEPPPEAEWRPLLTSCLVGDPDPVQAARAWRTVINDLAGERHDPERIDARIEEAIATISALEDPRISAAEIASRVGLSPSRFAHLFREQMGLPLRRYLVWLRLQNAIAALSRGGTLTEAAHTAGFADSAHFSRAFRRMFGVPPSHVVKYSTIVQARNSIIW